MAALRRACAGPELAHDERDGYGRHPLRLSAGWALMLGAGKPVFRYNWLNIEHYEVSAKDALSAGRHAIVVDFEYDGGGVGKGGVGTLRVDGREVARGRIAKTVPFRFTFDETFDVGEDTGTPVSEDYDVPFAFTGKIEKVTVHLGEAKLAGGEQKPPKAAQAESRAAE